MSGGASKRIIMAYTFWCEFTKNGSFSEATIIFFIRIHNDKKQKYISYLCLVFKTNKKRLISDHAHLSRLTPSSRRPVPTNVECDEVTYLTSRRSGPLRYGRGRRRRPPGRCRDTPSPRLPAGPWRNDTPWIRSRTSYTHLVNKHLLTHFSLKVFPNTSI